MQNNVVCSHSVFLWCVLMCISHTAFQKTHVWWWTRKRFFIFLLIKGPFEHVFSKSMCFMVNPHTPEHFYAQAWWTRTLFYKIFIFHGAPAHGFFNAKHLTDDDVRQMDMVGHRLLFDKLLCSYSVIRWFVVINLECAYRAFSWSIHVPMCYYS